MTDLSPRTADAPDASSEENIRRDWTAERRRMSRSFWGASSALGNAQGMAFLIALYLGVLSILPDSVLWFGTTGDETPSFIHDVDGLPLSIVLILLSLVNGMLLDLALTDQTAGKKPLRPIVRALRFLGCSLPPLGLAVPAFWYRLVHDRRDLLEATAPTRPILSAGRLFTTQGIRHFLEKRVSPLARRFLRSEWTFYWILVSNLLLPFAAIFWLSNPAEMTPGRYTAIVTTSAIAHLTAFAGAHCFFASLRREQTASWSQLLIAVLPLFWLVPLPMFFFLGLLPLLFVRGSRGDGTLTEDARGGRESAETWRKLEQSLREQRPQMSPWKRSKLGNLNPPAPPTIEQKHLLWLYKGKSAVLLFEAIFVTGALASLRGRMPAAIGAAEWLLGALAIGALPLGGTALAMHLIVVVSRLFRSGGRLQVLDEHPCLFYLGVTQLVFFMGCLIGVSLEGGNGQPIAGVLLAAGMVGMLAELAKAVLPIPERIRQPPSELVLWVVLFFSMSVIGLTMMREPGRTQAWMALLESTARFYPVMSVLLGGLLVGWLLRPFEGRHIFEPGISKRRRLLLAFLTVTAIAPLGGLFVPLWIYIRYRWWPAKIHAW